MESMVEFSEREWISLSGAYTAEESDFIASLLHNYSFPNDLSLEIPTSYWPTNESSLSMAASETSDSNIYGVSQGNNEMFESTIFPNPATLSMEFCLEDVRHTNSYQSHVDAAATNNFEKSPQPERKEDKDVVPIENSKKRSPCPADVEKTKRNVRTRKSHRLVSNSNNEEDHIVSSNRQSTSRSSFCSEDDETSEPQDQPIDSNGVTSALSLKGSAILNSNGKPRASRGSATDPQSLYARKRRERINERLKILQNLVPNGTKVDISTMLEEAVQYVKFLQLQIKLLSSDDLWMYAPLAYNGMDIGLNLKLMTQDNTSQ